MGYTKLFSEIITSSIWNEDDKTRVLWITMLAMSNADGYVSGCLPSLALMARMTNADCEKSLSVLSSPDENSRTPDHDGRRVEKVDGGWVILNYLKYRERVSDDPYAVSARERQRRFREKQKIDVTLRNATGRDPASASASGSVSDPRIEEGDARGNKDVPQNRFYEPILKLKDGHPAFIAVSEDAIIQELRGWPEERWMPAIDALLHRYDGAEIKRPIITLSNHLAGKQERGNGHHPKDRRIFSSIPDDEKEREEWRKRGWLDSKNCLKEECRDAARILRHGEE